MSEILFVGVEDGGWRLVHDGRARERCWGHNVTESRCLEALSRRSLIIIRDTKSNKLGRKNIHKLYYPIFFPSLCVAEHNLWFVRLLELVNFFVR